MQALSVRTDFRTFTRGELITDPAIIAQILAGSDSAHVVVTVLPDEPAPQPATTEGV